MSINCALHAEGLQNPFHVKWMHINIYLYVAITSMHKHDIYICGKTELEILFLLFVTEKGRPNCYPRLFKSVH
jgi:hypothetical protein